MARRDHPRRAGRRPHWLPRLRLRAPLPFELSARNRHREHERHPVRRWAHRAGGRVPARHRLRPVPRCRAQTRSARIHEDARRREGTRRLQGDAFGGAARLLEGHPRAPRRVRRVPRPPSGMGRARGAHAGDGALARKRGVVPRAQEAHRRAGGTHQRKTLHNGLDPRGLLLSLPALRPAGQPVRGERRHAGHAAARWDEPRMQRIPGLPRRRQRRARSLRDGRCVLRAA